MLIFFSQKERHPKPLYQSLSCLIRIETGFRPPRSLLHIYQSTLQGSLDRIFHTYRSAIEAVTFILAQLPHLDHLAGDFGTIPAWRVSLEYLINASLRRNRRCNLLPAPHAFSWPTVSTYFACQPAFLPKASLQKSKMISGASFLPAKFVVEQCRHFSSIFSGGAHLHFPHLSEVVLPLLFRTSLQGSGVTSSLEIQSVFASSHFEYAWRPAAIGSQSLESTQKLLGLLPCLPLSRSFVQIAIRPQQSAASLHKGTFVALFVFKHSLHGTAVIIVRAKPKRWFLKDGRSASKRNKTGLTEANDPNTFTRNSTGNYTDWRSQPIYRGIGFALLAVSVLRWPRRLQKLEARKAWGTSGRSLLPSLVCLITWVVIS